MTDAEQREECAESSNQTCPVCGQEYVHKRTQVKRSGKTQLRTDYNECKQPITGNREDYYVVYVHQTDRTVVNKLERGAEGSGSDSPSLLDAIRGVGK